MLLPESGGQRRRFRESGGTGRHCCWSDIDILLCLFVSEGGFDNACVDEEGIIVKDQFECLFAGSLYSVI